MPGKVFVVEPDPGSREYIVSAIRGTKYEVVAEVTTAEQAVELYKKHRPVVVLLPVVPSSTSELDAIRSIREMDPNAKVIVTYDRLAYNRVQEARRLGVQTSIRRPLERARIVASIALTVSSIKEPAHAGPLAMLEKPLVVDCKVLSGFLFRPRLSCTTRKIGVTGLDVRSEKYVKEGTLLELLIHFPRQKTVEVRGKVLVTAEQAKGTLYELFVSYDGATEEQIDAILAGIGEVMAGG